VATPSLNTSDLLQQLRAHFIKPGETWAGAVCLTEVTAPTTSRRADLVHIGLWNSRGAGGIDVCELKTSRADFRREIDQPAKAEAWWPYCNRFWIVSPHESVTPPGELPEGWGLMVPGKARRFRVVVKPAEHEAKLTVPLLVTLLKCTETTRVNAVQAERDKLRGEHYRELQKAREEARMNRADPAVKARLEHLDQLETALGAKLDRFPWRDQIHPEAAAEALRVAAATASEQRSARERARRQAEDLEQTAKELLKQAASLRGAVPVETAADAA
jgi:hypothetical protein